MTTTFEQYASQRLATILGESIDADLKPNKISVILTDLDDSRKFLVTVQLTIDCIYDAKAQAADTAQRIEAAVQSLRGDHNISRVNILSTTADRKGLLSKWQYRTVADFLIKAGVEW